MKQFQITKADMAQSRFVDIADSEMEPGDGEIVVAVERFGFSANNITYAVAGDRLGYWQFFPPVGGDDEGWGVVPVWGFAEIAESTVDELPTGERLFGYFPPATHLKMKPDGVSAAHFFDGATHRSELPRGYNVYRRVAAEPGYDKAHDNLRMLLFPLYITSFVLWDQLKENDWYGAEQIILTSASSKTSIGLAYALHGDDDAPDVIGLTSEGNLEFVDGLSIYDSQISYDRIADNIVTKPTVIVDMAGNGTVLGNLHKHLGDAMIKTINVGMTHWGGERGNPDINRDRSEFFFAPSRIQQRMKDWGPAEFDAKSTGFVRSAMSKSAVWLDLTVLEGLDSIEDIFADMRDGTVPPNLGIVIEP